MNEEDVMLDAELDNVINMIHSNDFECNPEGHTQSFIDQGDARLNDEPNQLLSLLDKSFQSREDLLSAVREIGLTQGCVMVIRRSKSNKYVIIGCDRGGTYRGSKTPAENRQKKSASRLINCPFQISGKMKVDGLWKLEIGSLSHNHELSNDFAGHPYCRRFSEEEALQVEQMHKAGIQPRQILSSLRQSNPNLLAISRNVYNKTAQIRKENLGGRSVIQALLDELGGAGFHHNVEYDQHGHLTHLFFAHPISIGLTKNYPDVFVMDCTYKTNKYGMPLLEVIGVSSFNKSFYSCFVFLQKEEEQDYVWALNLFSKLIGDDNHPVAIITDREMALINAIGVVFPRTSHLLCVWHIEKNIAGNCKSYFEEVDWVVFLSSWTDLVRSADEPAFSEAWNRFEVKYKEYASVLSYIRKNWLPWKEKFVFAWTNQVCHFGSHVSSRAEGAHATLKLFLQVSTGGLPEVKEKICLAIQHQFHELKTQLSSEKIRVPQKLSMTFFRELVTKVSLFALYELHKQYVLANTKDYSSECKGHFFKTMGLPCVHMIRKMNIEVLPLNQIHKQWRIGTRSFTDDPHAAFLNDDSQFNDLMIKIKEKYEKLPLTQKENTNVQLSHILSGSLPLIFEPSIQPHKGRPVGSKKRSSSTKRDPSHFEMVEKNKKKPPTCSQCHIAGHIRTYCPSRDK